MLRRKLFQTEVRVLRYLQENGASELQEIREASGSRGHPGHFLDRLEERGLIEEIESHRALGRSFVYYKITPKGKKY